ncbi:MAG: DNA gyrase inhibitor YacG [Pirellulaceae bacterium]|nr:DNA gyrase inhibitor YacG [Pirellulaceae bacterium]MDP6554275.1 DNA gyrase inhibitor YacG [Pirellulaceae bacterium]
MATMRCSICKKQFDSEESTSMPFCSERCKQIDLGRWLNEDYGMPAEPSEDEHESEAEQR